MMQRQVYRISMSKQDKPTDDIVDAGFFRRADLINITLVREDGTTSKTRPFTEVKEGWIVSRDMGGAVMKLGVTSVDERFIYCGPIGFGWKFDRATGIEVDEDLGWGPQFGKVGSYLVDAQSPS